MPHAQPTTGLRFDVLVNILPAEADIPPLQCYTARDGGTLNYRYYSARCASANEQAAPPSLLVLLHGSSASSHYLAPMAEYLATSAGFDVLTPDLRGHGPNPMRRGDVDYIGQLEDDLADLIEHAKHEHAPHERVVIGGHSSGGGLALRFAAGKQAGNLAGVVLLAPFLAYNAATVRKKAGWAKPNLWRIVPLALLNQLRVTRFNHWPVLQFNLPLAYRTGSETLRYTYRMMESFGTANYKADLANIRAPILVLVGDRDEAFYAKQFEPTIHPHAPQSEFAFIAGVSHLDIVVNTTAAQRIALWAETHGL